MHHENTKLRHCFCLNPQAAVLSRTVNLWSVMFTADEEGSVNRVCILSASESLSFVRIPSEYREGQKRWWLDVGKNVVTVLMYADISTA